jgi:hypothetical protein
MATPAFMLQRQQNFRFEKTNEIVAYYLDDSDLTAITHWQTQLGYTFEFHEMHDIGNPIYIRPDGNTSTSSMTKIDTKKIADPALHYKNKAKPTAPWIENIANYSVISKLGTTKINEIAGIFSGEWKYLQKLADRRWSGWKRPPPPETLIERAIRTGQYPPPPLNSQGK